VQEFLSRFVRLPAPDRLFLSSSSHVSDSLEPVPAQKITSDVASTLEGAVAELGAENRHQSEYELWHYLEQISGPMGTEEADPTPPSCKRLHVSHGQHRPLGAQSDI
jgi:hypothetical protein